MKLKSKPKAEKQLRRLSPLDRKKVTRKIRLLKINPYAGKKLKGEIASLYSLKAWPYRITYALTEDAIIIHSITHRQSAYK